MLVYVSGHQRELPLRCKRLCSMVDGLRAVLSASSTIYRWQNATKSVPQTVTAHHRVPSTVANQQNAAGAPPSIRRGSVSFPRITTQLLFTAINSEIPRNLNY